MARGGKDRKIELWFLEPIISEFETYENLTDQQLTEKVGWSCSIDIRRPVASICGEGYAYYYDQMAVEEDATPMGLGMADGDTVAIWDTSTLRQEFPEDKLLHLKMRIINLNQVVGEQKEGLAFPLEVVQHSKLCILDVDRICSDVANTKQHRRATDWAQDEDFKGYAIDSAKLFFQSYKGKHLKKSFCLMGLAWTKYRMESKRFKNICEVLDEMLPWISRCEKEGWHDIDPDRTERLSPCREMVDIFLVSLPDTLDTCFRKLVTASGVGISGFFAGEWNEIESVYVGPARSSIMGDYCSPVPILHLTPYTQEATLQDLVSSWVYYALQKAIQKLPYLPHDQKRLKDLCKFKDYTDFLRRHGLQHLIGPYRLTYNKKEIAVSSRILVADVIDNLLNKHYFVISGPEWGDSSDIGQLAEFVEDKIGEKEKNENRDSSKDALKRDQERNGKHGQLTSTSVGSCPPPDRLKNVKKVDETREPKGEKKKTDGTHKTNMTKEKVTLETNMPLLEIESPLASLKPLLNTAVNSPNSSFTPVFDHITATFKDIKDNSFLRHLIGVLVEVCLEDKGNLVKLNMVKLTRISGVLVPFLYANKDREVQALYSLQSFVHRLEHPKRLLHSIFDVLYHVKLISEEAFIEWKWSTETGEQEGKEAALKSCTQFFQRLRPSEPEDDPEVENTKALEDKNTKALEDENTKALEDELAIKEAKLQELWERDRDLVESTGKEMSLLISTVDSNEDEKHAMQKQMTELNSQMDSITDQLARLQATVNSLQERKDRLSKDILQKDENLNKSLKKKRILEDYITQEVDANKQVKVRLEQEIESIKTRMEDTNKSKESKSEKVMGIKPEIQKFLEHINKKIDAKERDLECSICLEVSSAPIYCCDEQHIICSDCRPKVSMCKSNKVSRILGLWYPLSLRSDLWPDKFLAC